VPTNKHKQTPKRRGPGAAGQAQQQKKSPDQKEMEKEQEQEPSSCGWTSGWNGGGGVNAKAESVQ